MTLSPSSTFTGTASLACSGLPAGANCSFANSTVALGSAPVSTTLTISVGAASTASLATHSGMFAFWLPGLGLGMVVAGKQRRSRKFWIGLVVLVLLAVMVSVGCGGVASVALRPQQLETGLQRQAWLRNISHHDPSDDGNNPTSDHGNSDSQLRIGRTRHQGRRQTLRLFFFG